MNKLIKDIEDWAASKGLIDIRFVENQYLKFLEELGEASSEILVGNKSEMIMELGDVAVTIIILAKQLSIELITRDVSTTEDTMGINSFVSSVSPQRVHAHSLYKLAKVCNLYGLNIEECLSLACNKIKERKGETKNGNFIKNEGGNK